MRRLVWVLGAMLAACNDTEALVAGAPGPAPTATAPGARAATVAIYGAPQEGALTPFPSDRFAVDDAGTATGRRVQIDGRPGDALFQAFSGFSGQLSGGDGFSTVGGVAVSFSGDLDPALLSLGVDDYTTMTTPLALVDVDEASPDRGKAVPLVVRYHATPTLDDGPRVDFTLVAQPAWPLRPRTSYLFAVTTRLRDRKGRPVGPTEGTDALLAGGEGAYGGRLRKALPLLKSAVGAGPEQVALASLFTTASVIDETFAMAKGRRAAPAPELKGALSVVGQGQGGDRRVRFKGRYNAPEFRKTKGDGRFEIAQGAPVVQGEVDLEFLLSISDREAVGPRPVVIYGHGLGGDKEGVWGTSERLAALGAAVIGIDAPEHGSRGKATDAGFSSVFNFFALDDATGRFDLFRARDNFRQMASDQLELVRLIGELSKLDVLPVGAPDGVPDLDTTRIFYIGHSFGSVLASTALAVAPEIKAACLNVGGDGLMTVIRESPTFKLLAKGLMPAGLTEGDVARFYAASQAIIDPGDPLNYAPYVARQAGPGVAGWAPRQVLLQEVYGDKIVPNLSSELLARGLGLSQMKPAVSFIGGLPEAAAPVAGNLGKATGVFFQFDRMEGGKAAEHGGLIFSPEARGQYVKFFQGAAAGEVATVIDPYAQ